MLGSTGIVHHLVVASSYVPRFYDRRTYDTMKYTVETTHRILCKVIQHYLDDADYRTIFSYDERLAELILLPRGYDALLPFARFDVFLDENDLTLGFCEFNGDGLVRHERKPRNHEQPARRARPARVRDPPPGAGMRAV